MANDIELNDDYPILDQLHAEQIFCVFPKKDKFEFTEACDCYYSVTVTKEQILKLIEELKELIQ